MTGAAIVFCFIVVVTASELEKTKINFEKFPDDFLFGTATSAYQIEGAWDSDGKGESNWDHFAHTKPERIEGGGNGDMVCDGYNKYKEDVARLKDLGVDFYRFSISWSRILPSGLSNKVNKAGVDYYNNLINELLANNIKPVVTLFHWDLPQNLQSFGGFTNPLIENWFYEYAKICFKLFGDRVKVWITFNEPRQMCLGGYAFGFFAPGLLASGVGEYLCGHNLLKAHARAYHLYDDQFRKTQKGKIGIVLDCTWYEPVTDTKEDHEAAERARQFYYGWLANPIFTTSGDYPYQMKEFIGNRSIEEGFPTSRLPKFSLEEINYIKGTSDYFGLNHYSTKMTEHKLGDPIGEPSHTKDCQVQLTRKDEWIGVKTFLDVPWGFRKLLNWIKQSYGDIEIYVTENGFADHGFVHDNERINFHTGYLSNLLDAIHEDKVKVKLYTVWSFLDVFEWNSGYTLGFGLHQVNFSNPLRPRTPKDSAKFYKKVIAERRLPLVS